MVGFKYVEDPLPLETDGDLLALFGKSILHAWDTDAVKSCFVGKGSARGVSARDL